MGRAQVIKADNMKLGGEVLIGYRALENDPFMNSYDKDNLLEPPYPLSPLLQMTEYSTILQQCIDAYKRNIPGFGVQLSYIEDTVTTGNETPEQQAEWDYVTSWLKYFNFDMSFKDVWEVAIDHREKCGNGYIELIRDGADRVAGGDNVDPEFVRLSKLSDPVSVTYNTVDGTFNRKKRFRKYAQRLSSGTTIWFKEFGDPRFLNCTTGEYTPVHNGEDEATEILHIKIGDKPYGIPRWIGHLVHMYGARNAEELNFNYFKNGRHIPLAVIVSNGMLTEESAAALQNYANNIKGVDNAHGFLLLEAEGLDVSELPGEEEKTGVKVELKPLAEILQQDGLFLDYDKESRQKVQSVFRLADLYVGRNQDFNKATADTARQVTEEQVFEPERESLEFVINEKMLATHEVKHVRVTFKSPHISDTDEKVKLLQVYKEINAIAPNDVREEVGRLLGKDLENFNIPEADLPIALANLVKQQQNIAEQVQQKQQAVNVKKAMETDEFITLLKDIRDEVSDYNALIEKVRTYSEAS